MQPADDLANNETNSTEEHVDPTLNFPVFQGFNTTISLPNKPLKFNPKGPASNQIVVLSAGDGFGNGSEFMMEQAIQNRKLYCERHGYIYSFVDMKEFDLGDSAMVWKKLPAIIKAFNDHPTAQWVFWLDLDAIIMTQSQDLQSLILSHAGMEKNFDLGAELHNKAGIFFPLRPDYSQIDVIIAQDESGINAGSLFLRRSHFTQILLDIWADPFFVHSEWGLKEQEALVHLMKHHKTFKKHIGIAKQRAINAFDEGDPGWRSWQPGDLVVHLASCRAQDNCAQRWKAQWALREGHENDEPEIDDTPTSP